MVWSVSDKAWLTNHHKAILNVDIQYGTSGRQYKAFQWTAFNSLDLFGRRWKEMSAAFRRLILWHQGFFPSLCFKIHSWFPELNWSKLKPPGGRTLCSALQVFHFRCIWRKFNPPEKLFWVGFDLMILGRIFSFETIWQVTCYFSHFSFLWAFFFLLLPTIPETLLLTLYLCIAPRSSQPPITFFMSCRFFYIIFPFILLLLCCLPSVTPSRPDPPKGLFPVIRK